MELERRRVATQRTLDKYRGTTFDWAGDTTCVHLARSHMIEMGHEPPEIPEFTTPAGAVRALKERGWDSVEDMLDELLPRIAPAQMVLGDLAIIPGDAGLDAIFICAGPLKVFGWTTEQPQMALVDMFDMGQLTGAWRV